MPYTCVSAAGEAMPAANINRRLAMLGGVTATAAALAVGTASSPEAVGAADIGLTPIMALFRQWETEWRDEEGDILAVERKMLALPSSSAADFAAKLIAHTGYGAFAVDDGSPLFKEALALTGATGDFYSSPSEGGDL